MMLVAKAIPVIFTTGVAVSMSNLGQAYHRLPCGLVLPHFSLA